MLDDEELLLELEELLLELEELLPFVVDVLEVVDPLPVPVDESSEIDVVSLLEEAVSFDDEEELLRLANEQEDKSPPARRRHIRICLLKYFITFIYINKIS